MLQKSQLLLEWGTLASLINLNIRNSKNCEQLVAPELIN